MRACQFAKLAFDRALKRGYVTADERNTFAADLADEISFAMSNNWTIEEFIEGFVR